MSKGRVITQRNVTGKVKWFNPEKKDPETGISQKNFGFITFDDAARGDAFVHGNDVAPGSLPLTDGMRVVFDVSEGPKGSKAVNVARADPA